MVVNMSAEVHASAEELRAERQRIHTRMDRLEERVDGMQQGRGLKLNNSSNNHSDDANFIQVREQSGTFSQCTVGDT